MKPFAATCYKVILPVLLVAMASCKGGAIEPGITPKQSRNYFISNDGNDANDGSRLHPWKNIAMVNGLILAAGDSILLRGGQTFNGSITLKPFTAGIRGKPVVMASYGIGQATVNSGNDAGLVISNSHYLYLQNIKFIGTGRKKGNITSGVVILHSTNINIDSLDIAGFQKSGLLVRSSSDITAQNIYAHDNGYAGIAVDGETVFKKDCRNINLLYCRAENNPGDPTNFKNHSGNGIIVSQCSSTKIAWCTATNNGWDMPRIGNGPVGIWAWDADSLTIEHCLSYRNKTSKGGEDGGGFDFDGGITNSVIQYCLSYENEGSGIGLFEYDQAGPWYNNTIRYNISINDGAVSAAKAAIYIWNASTAEKLKNCLIYNNTIINNRNAAIRFAKESGNEGFVFYNNILAGNHEIISGSSITGKYLGNCWWSFKDSFNINKPINFSAWAAQQQQETLKGTLAGVNINPGFTCPDTMTTDAKMLIRFRPYKTLNPVLPNGGVNLQLLFGIQTGGKDFNGNVPPKKGIGACF